MPTALQYVGTDSVVDAYTRYNIKTWGLYQGKEPVCYGQTAEGLHDWLTSLEPARSTALMHLRLYRDYEPEDIDKSTPYTATFGFKLNEPEMYGYRGMGSPGLNERLAAIEKKLNAPVEDEDESLVDIAMGWLKDPVQLQQVVGAIKMVLGGISAPAPVMATTMGNIAQTKPQIAQMTTEQEYQLIGDTVDRLKAKDPQIVQHLQKLANLAETQPSLFKILLNQLDAL